MPETVQSCIRMPKDIKDKLQAIADADERSFAFVVNKACKQYIEKNQDSE